MDADTLLYEPLEKPSFVVDGLIPTGLSLFCGSQKIGKSWLMLKLCLCLTVRCVAGTRHPKVCTIPADFWCSDLCIHTKIKRNACIPQAKAVYYMVKGCDLDGKDIKCIRACGA